MEVHFASPDLRVLDTLGGDALSVHLYSDERPLRGALGLVDWRLCGQVSRLLLAERITGAPRECTLIAGRPGLAFDRLFVFGLGPREQFDEAAFVEASIYLLDTLAKVRVRASVCAMPGRGSLALPRERAMELFLQVAGTHGDQDEITLLDDPEAQRVMRSVVRRVRRQAKTRQG